MTETPEMAIKRGWDLGFLYHIILSKYMQFGAPLDDAIMQGELNKVLTLGKQPAVSAQEFQWIKEEAKRMDAIAINLQK